MRKILKLCCTIVGKEYKPQKLTNTKVSIRVCFLSLIKTSVVGFLFYYLMIEVTAWQSNKMMTY